MKPLQSLLTIILVLVAVSGVWAAEAPHEPGLKASDLPDFGKARDPFWPRGYSRVPVSMSVEPSTNAAAAPVVAKWPALEPMGFMKSAKGDIVMFKNIKGMWEEGQVVKRVVGGLEYSYKLVKIEAAEKKIQFEKAGVRPAPAGRR